jgi:phosphoribosylformylglycinamidine synthase
LFGLGGSAYLQRIHGLKTGLPPRCDLINEKRVHDALRALICSGLVKSAHDCSEGGLAAAVAESCISHQVARDTPRLVGAEVDLTLLGSGRPSTRLDVLLFGETQSRVLISVANSNAGEVLRRAKDGNVSAARLGTVGGASLKMKIAKRELTWDLRELHDLWWNSITRAMK